MSWNSEGSPQGHFHPDAAHSGTKTAKYAFQVLMVA